MNFTALEEAMGRLTAITKQFNCNRTTKLQKVELIKQAVDARKAIVNSGGTQQDIKDATYGKPKP